MAYSATLFRKNMGEVLDKIRYDRKIEFIGRRNKKEFVVMSYEVWKEHNYDEEIDNGLTDAMKDLDSSGDLDKFDSIINKKEKEGRL